MFLQLTGRRRQCSLPVWPQRPCLKDLYPPRYIRVLGSEDMLPEKVPSARILTYGHNFLDKEQVLISGLENAPQRHIFDDLKINAGGS